MIPRDLASVVVERARQLPVVTLTGPRQSGKTTLCRAAFPDKPYVSLENPDVREEALGDPRGFLARYPDGAVLDEIQRAPDLPSYLQGLVDDRRRNGQWILTGSQNFVLLERISQSLAGRSAMLQLLPLSVGELARAGLLADDVEAQVLRGGYPRLYDQVIPSPPWFADYVMNYVERDVRQVLEIGDLATFQTFLRLCAGRAGQVLNLSSLGADCGVSQTTARRWISVLEASYVVFRLQPLHRNVTKRLTKSPKLHFYDTGLACHLLGIRSKDDLAWHPLRGALFESWVASELLKWRWNRDLPADLYYYRDARGAEVDLVIERARGPIAVEVKSSRTTPTEIAPPFAVLEATLRAAPIPPRSVERRLVYAGDRRTRVEDVEVVPWCQLGQQAWE